MNDLNEMKLHYSHVVSEKVMSKLIELLFQDEENSVVLSGIAMPSSLLSLRGLGKELWKGVDAQDYVNKLRSEWND